ncbi:MAG: GNAT family N-acetyltransferase [Elusimicrobiales bacterium]|nr:GNAT family N-acetyltransferase [Elusimicrobiales bacterium]
MEIKYLTPGPGNLREVMGLMPLLYREIGPGLALVMEELIKDDAYFKLLALDEAGAPAGFMAGGCRLELDFECRAGIIEDIIIRPDLQRRGIGKAMLAEFEKWCSARGAAGVLVPCGRPGFYEKAGFEKLPVTRYWKELPAR